MFRRRKELKEQLNMLRIEDNWESIEDKTKVYTIRSNRIRRALSKSSTKIRWRDVKKVEGVRVDNRRRIKERERS